MSARVYLVEDHPLVREMLREYITTRGGMEVCGAAADPDAAAAELPDAAPDVVLIDLALPGRSGLDLLTEVRERWGIPCVIVSGYGDRSDVARALASGASGYVLKGDPADVARAIEAAVAGDVFLSGELYPRNA